MHYFLSSGAIILKSLLLLLVFAVVKENLFNQFRLEVMSSTMTRSIWYTDPWCTWVEYTILDQIGNIIDLPI